MTHSLYHICLTNLMKIIIKMLKILKVKYNLALFKLWIPWKRMCMCLYHMNKFEKKETKQRMQKSHWKSISTKPRWLRWPFLGIYMLHINRRTQNWKPNLLTILTGKIMPYSIQCKNLLKRACLLLTSFLCLYNQLISVTFYCHILKNTDAWKMWFIK